MSDRDAVMEVLKSLDITQKKHMASALLTREQRDEKEVAAAAKRLEKSEARAAAKVSTRPRRLRHARAPPAPRRNHVRT